MNDDDLIMQQRRIERYRSLKKVQVELNSAIKRLSEPWADGPSGQGPFTGNTRESRDVVSLHIGFSPTKGGAASVSMTLSDLNISAPDFRQALEGLLRARLNLINEALEKL